MSKLGSEIPQNHEVVMKHLWVDHGQEVAGLLLKF